MNPLGAGLLGLCAVGSGGLVLRPAWRSAGIAMIAGWWAAVLLLGQRFVALDLSLREVVAYSRAELSTPLRFSGLWAGPSGSLLLWCAMMVTAAAVAVTQTGRTETDTRRPVRLLGVRLIGLCSLVAVAVVVVGANPFIHDITNPVNGRGLSPVLEHRAMIVHPPLLYLAHAVTLFAALFLWLNPNSARSRPVIGAAIALLVAATMIGAWWAHDELGWGGWWAWDPVENTALAPLACLIAALHATSRWAQRRWAMLASSMVFIGVAAARSGLASSVHSFAPSPGPSVAVCVAGIALAVVAGMGLNKDVQIDRPVFEGSAPRWRKRVASLLAVSAGWVAMVVLSAEAGAAWLGRQDPAGTLDGTMVGRLMIPAGLAVIAGLVVWGWRVRRLAIMFAHVGVAIFAVGVIASMADWREAAVLDFGSTAELHGTLVTVGERVEGEQRIDVARVEVPVTIDGHIFRPSILRYRDIDRTRSRPSRSLDWRGETEVVTTFVDSTKARIELRRHPGLGQVWLGGALIVIGCASLALGWALPALPFAFRGQQGVD